MTRLIVKQILLQSIKVLSWLIYVVTIMAAYGGYFNPERWTLPAISVLLFPYLAILSIVVAAFWLIRRHFIIGGVGILILMACGPTFTEALPFRFAHTASNTEKTFKMVTFNCMRMRDQKEKSHKLSRSLHFLIHSDADFICLQELYHLWGEEIPKRYSSQLDSLLKIYPYYSEDNKELKFFSKYPFEQQNINIKNGVQYGKCAAYRLMIDGDSLTVINVHLPSYSLSTSERHIITEVRSKAGVKKSIKQFENSVYKKMRAAFRVRGEVAKAVAEYASSIDGNVIVCGDFNDVPGSWSYRNFTKRGFDDAYAETGFGHLITYNQHLMWFHIDHILYKGNLMPLYVRKDHLNSSDHYPLIAEFEFL